MSAPLDKLNEHIDQLVHWLRENQGIKLKPDQKTRIKSVLIQVKSTQTLGVHKGKNLNRKPMINCKYCGVTVNFKNINKHKKKCIGQRELQNGSPIAGLPMKKNSLKIPADEGSENETKSKEPKDSWRSKGTTNVIRFPDL